MFVKLSKSANVLPSQGRRPRLNELRHTFAVRALESSPAGRQRVGRHMVALATYMGHTNCEATHWYLESTPELMQDIADAGEHYLWGRKP
jgi:integrase